MIVTHTDTATSLRSLHFPPALPLLLGVLAQDANMGGGSRDALPTLSSIASLFASDQLAAHMQPPPVVILTGCEASSQINAERAVTRHCGC